MRECICGSGQPSWQLFDARGIYVTRVCKVCLATTKAKYRPEIFTNSSYHADEPIDEE